MADIPFQIITVARKPLKGPIARTVLISGCGAINVSATRIGHSEPGGRWPANVLLSHKVTCECQGTKRVKGSGTSTRFHDSYEGTSHTSFLRGHSHPGNQHSDPDGMEEMEHWACERDCAVADLDRQSGDHDSGKVARDDMTPTTHEGPAKFGYSPTRHQFCYGDSGGVSRYFKQVKETD